MSACFLFLTQKAIVWRKLQRGKIPRKKLAREARARRKLETLHNSLYPVIIEDMKKLSDVVVDVVVVAVVVEK